MTNDYSMLFIIENIYFFAFQYEMTYSKIYTHCVILWNNECNLMM